jgi:hypothetical protein
LLTEDLLNQELTQTLIKTDDSEITIPQCYLRLYVGSSNLASTPNISKIKTILRFYRDATEEELEFAEIADQCP